MGQTYDQSVGYPTVLSGRRIVHMLYLHLKDYGITPEQWTVLRFLKERDGITQKQLSEASGKDQPTLTRILTIMMKKGWIQRKANKEDGRSFLIFVTPLGSQLFVKLEPVVEEAFSKILSGIPAENLEVLKWTLRQMDANMENEIHRVKVQ
jgi:DNA-binding MarR family transcriptional regulator